MKPAPTRKALAKLHKSAATSSTNVELITKCLLGVLDVMDATAGTANDFDLEQLEDLGIELDEVLGWLTSAFPKLVEIAVLVRSAAAELQIRHDAGNAPVARSADWIDEFRTLSRQFTSAAANLQQFSTGTLPEPRPDLAAHQLAEQGVRFTRPELDRAFAAADLALTQDLTTKELAAAEDDFTEAAAELKQLRAGRALRKPTVTVEEFGKGHERYTLALDTLASKFKEHEAVLVSTALRVLQEIEPSLKLVRPGKGRGRRAAEQGADVE
ncbi:hypothetical protein M8C13_07025 [Crossiella sp. SN42]|uniref:hypothetical protein n=1 Tax=Crossiella sp. SN42 TaxID=2944808 RepID=UPI00207D33EB|nr:hypothetical protein [Crossiella sp. SN42]MCO1575509.1 hypothetical protein [Crossiella sp. SN42]